MTQTAELTITHEPTTNPAPLYAKYDGQILAQGAYIAFDASRMQLFANHNHEIGGAVSTHVWHGHEQRFPVPPAIKATVLNSLLDEIAPQLVEAAAGYESRWNGSNQVAVWTEDAQAILEAVRQRCEEIGEDECMAVWDVGEWLHDSRTDIIAEVRAGAKPGELADRYRAEALAEGTVLDGDVQQWIEQQMEATDGEPE